MKQTVCLLFPHQLFADNPLMDRNEAVWMVEEHLFFNQYKFHKLKLAFHRASMKAYQDYLSSSGIKVNYVEAKEENSDMGCTFLEVCACAPGFFQPQSPNENAACQL